tara:strand:+ start:3659 stop:3910 length:252 start_codon:yes stop_codon:yes gene_type:complete
MTFCPFVKFNKILGIPGKGVHYYQILNTAMVDYFLTLFGSFLLTYLTNIPLVLTTIFLFILGIIMHILFGIPTEAVKYLGFIC